MTIGRWLARWRRGSRWTPVAARRDRQAGLDVSYLAFKDLITSNDQLLELIADIEQKLDGRTYFGAEYVRVKAVECATHAYRMLRALDTLSHRRYQELHLVFASLQKAIEQDLAAQPPRPRAREPRLVYPIRLVDAGLADAVGGKSAHVGEIRNRAGLPVPESFAVSTEAFRAVMDHDGLAEEVRALLGGFDPARPDEVDEVSRQVQRVVAGSSFPPGLAEALDEAFRALACPTGAAAVSVRSSAVGEDGDVSFAGQYTTVLNVGREGLADAYREVIAGLYSPAALYYRRLQHIPDDDVAMGVLCMAMVPARASGVACSADPNNPDSGVVVVSGSWGLGLATVDGSVSPDVWEVSREDGRIVGERIGSKDTRTEPSPLGGVAAVPVPPPLRGQPCLTPDQVAAVAGLTLAAERHYGRPREIEWALDEDGRLFVLQARSLTVSAGNGASRIPPGAEHRILLRGAGASVGCASGPVVRLTGPEGLAGFPAGAVAVARHSSPQFVRIMGRAAAIVTDVGAKTGHMASLAREFRLPAVLDTGTATATLVEGQVVTVCGTSGLVFEGNVDGLVEAKAEARDAARPASPGHALLGAVARHVVPLTLTDPAAAEFTPRGCRTLHDLARFAHEKAFEEMFRLSDRVADASARAVLLQERLPFQLFLIDVGGGLARPGARVRAGDIRSTAMRPLLAGMLDPALRWSEPRPIAVSGFLSVAARSLVSPLDEGGQRDLGDRSYALVADAYCNFSSRIGYHFAAVDAYCSESTTRNYVSFRFKGGAADPTRRARRCEMIAEVLRRLDFSIERTGDFVTARLRKYPAPAVAERLEWLGRLVVATRQLDMRMSAATGVDWFVRAFFAGNYLFEYDQRGGTGPGA